MGRSAKVMAGVVLAAMGTWVLLRGGDGDEAVAEGSATARARAVPPPLGRIDDGSPTVLSSAAPSKPMPERADRSPAKGCALSRGDDEACPFLEPDHDTLEEMARCGIARVETPRMPGPASGIDAFPEAWRETAGVTRDEHERLERAAAEFAAKEREQWADLAATVGIDRAWAETSAPFVVSSRVFAEFDEEQHRAAIERIARERAGWEPDDDAVPAALDAAMRLRLDVGVAYETAIGEAVGAARAAELRAAADGWPGTRTHVGNGCEVEPEPPRAREFVPRTAAEAEACIDDPKARHCAFLDPTKLELKRMAECGIVRFDAPGFVGDRFAEPTFDFDERWASEVGLTPDEAAVVAEVGESFRESLYRDLTALVLEAGKSQAWADQTPFMGMMIAIAEGSGATPQDVEAMFRRLAEERAGRVDPPSDLASRSIDERFMRRVIELGDAFEQALADRLGEDRARALRTFDDGWPGLRLQTQNYCDASGPKAL
jgi:hypothetical protein